MVVYNESPPTYYSAEITNVLMFLSPNMKIYPPIPTVVILLSLVHKKYKPVEVKERKVVYLNTSTNEEVVLKEKLARVLEDMINLKLVPKLEDEIHIH